MFKKMLLTLVSLLLISLLFIDIPAIMPIRLMLSLWPIGHIVVFAFIALLQLTYSSKLKQSSFSQRFFYLTATSFLIGICVELIQPLFSRTAEIEDLFNNYIGTLAVIIFSHNTSVNQSVKYTLRVVYSGFLIYLLVPTVATAYDEYRQLNDFPVIANFDHQSSLTRWKADHPLTLLKASTVIDTQSNLLQATFTTKKASRVVLRYFNGDWQNGIEQGYQQLQLRFFNPNTEPLPLTVIATDSHYDKSNSDGRYRFSTILSLDKGWSTHNIALSDIEQKPVARNIDLANMAGIDFYMYKLKTPTLLYIDEIKLVP